MIRTLLHRLACLLGFHYGVLLVHIGTGAHRARCFYCGKERNSL